MNIRRPAVPMFSEVPQRWLGGLAAALVFCSGLSMAGDLNNPHQHTVKLGTGVYYPGPYYSRAYIQDYPIEPYERPLAFRLLPFQHYGRYKLGCPIEPNLTDGTLNPMRFPYRYAWDFEPTVLPPTPTPDPCLDPRLRHLNDSEFERPPRLPQTPPPPSPGS